MGRFEVQARNKKIASSSSNGDATFHDNHLFSAPQILKWFVRIRLAASCSMVIITLLALYVFLSPYVQQSPEQQQQLIDAAPPRAAQQIVAMSLVLSIPFYDIAYLDLSMQSTLDQTFLPSEVLLIISGIPHEMIPQKAMEHLKRIYDRYAKGFAQRATICPLSSPGVHLLHNSQAEEEVTEVPPTRRLLRTFSTKKTNVLIDDGRNSFKDCFKLFLYGREGEKLQGDNRVFGFKRSTEKIVTFFGSSDFMLPQRIEVLYKVFALHHELDAVIHRHVDLFKCKGSGWLNEVLMNWEVANISSELTQNPNKFDFFSHFFQSFWNALSITMPYSNWNKITLKAFPSNRSIPVSFLNLRSQHFLSNIDETVSSSDIFITTYKKIRETLPTFVPTSNSNSKAEPNWPGQPHWSFPIGMNSITELPHNNGWMTIRRRVVDEKGVNMPEDLVSGEDSVFNWRMIKAGLKWNAVPMQLGIFCHVVEE